jgi:hypothetical protein
MKINNDNTTYNQNKGEKNHVIVVIEKHPLGISIIPSSLTKSLKKQGIEITSFNIIKDLCDKRIDNIFLSGKKLHPFFQ